MIEHTHTVFGFLYIYLYVVALHISFFITILINNYVLGLQINQNKKFIYLINTARACRIFFEKKEGDAMVVEKCTRLNRNLVILQILCFRIFFLFRIIYTFHTSHCFSRSGDLIRFFLYRILYNGIMKSLTDMA